MSEEDEDVYETCVGRLCFLRPYERYVPPPYYSLFPRQDYRWKIGAKIKGSPAVQCKVSHSVALPNILGLGPEARWRWQWAPISLMTSGVMYISSHRSSTSDSSVWDGTSEGARAFAVGIAPRARLKVLTPVFGKLALRPTVELLPTPVLIVRRQFRFGTTKLTLEANVEMSNMVGNFRQPQWSFQVNWHPSDAVKVMPQPRKGGLAMQYSRSFNLLPEFKVVATGLAEVPRKLPCDNSFRYFPLRASFDAFKVSHIITDKSAKTTPLSTWRYLRASRRIGMNDHISVIPGHWIDPGPDTGAPGEREFNMDVANMMEKQLMGNGWKVLRPDRDSPSLTWEEYLNWVSKQSIQGIPVLEIHGQGSKADSRGFVLGVIGDANAPLNKELAKDFGFFKMDWMEMGVSKRGGVVLETFNSDEVLQMAPWHRKWSVRRLANRIVACIERASHDNRVSRGIILGNDMEDDPLALDRSLTERRH